MNNFLQLFCNLDPKFYLFWHTDMLPSFLSFLNLLFSGVSFYNAPLIFSSFILAPFHPFPLLLSYPTHSSLVSHDPSNHLVSLPPSFPITTALPPPLLPTVSCQTIQAMLTVLSGWLIACWIVVNSLANDWRERARRGEEQSGARLESNRLMYGCRLLTVAEVNIITPTPPPSSQTQSYWTYWHVQHKRHFIRKGW